MKRTVSPVRWGLALAIASSIGACATGTTTVSLTESNSARPISDRVTSIFQNESEVTLADTAIALARLNLASQDDLTPSELAAAASELLQIPVTLDAIPDTSAFDFAEPEDVFNVADVATLFAAIDNESATLSQLGAEVGMLLGRSTNPPRIIRVPGEPGLPTPSPSPSIPTSTVVFFEGTDPFFGGNQGSNAYSVTFNPPGVTPAPFREDGSQLEAHPFDNRFIRGVYAALASRDLFDRVSGNPRNITEASPPFGASSTVSPHGLEPLGITGQLHLSWVGVEMDVNNPAQYFFEDDRGDGILRENRVYSGGIMRLFEETAPGEFRLLTEYNNMTIQLVILWDEGNPLESRVAGSFTGDVTANSTFNLPVTYSFDSGNPVNAEGTTQQGLFGSFSLVAGAGFSFDLSDPSAIPPL